MNSLISPEDWGHIEKVLFGIGALIFFSILTSRHEYWARSENKWMTWAAFALYALVLFFIGFVVLQLLGNDEY